MKPYIIVFSICVRNRKLNITSNFVFKPYYSILSNRNPRFSKKAWLLFSVFSLKVSFSLIFMMFSFVMHIRFFSVFHSLITVPLLNILPVSITLETLLEVIALPSNTAFKYCFCDSSSTICVTCTLIPF